MPSKKHKCKPPTSPDLEKTSSKSNSCGLKIFLDKRRLSGGLFRPNWFGSKSPDRSGAKPKCTVNVVTATEDVESRHSSIPINQSKSPLLQSSSDSRPFRHHVIQDGKEVGNAPHMFSEPPSEQAFEFVEEQYEESLAHFSDLIIEGLKSVTQATTTVPKPSSDPAVDFSLSLSLSTTTDRMGASSSPRFSSNQLSPSSGLIHDQQQLTPPVNFSSMQFLPTFLPPLTTVDPRGSNDAVGSIYNEPCDAKPLVHDGDGSMPIYTMDGFTPDDRSARCVGLFHGSDVSIPNGLSDADAQSLQLRVATNKTLTGEPIVISSTNSEAFQSTTQPIRYLTSSKSGDLFTIPSSTATMADFPSLRNSHQLAGSYSANCSPSPHSSHSNSGFVDGPRGNSRIHHHPTSPFSPVARPTTHSPSSKSSSTPSMGEAMHPASDMQINLNVNHGNPTIQPKSQMEPPLYETQASLSSPKTTETYPTYEEAWDIKMNRQFGFDITRLTSTNNHVAPRHDLLQSRKHAPSKRNAPLSGSNRKQPQQQPSDSTHKAKSSNKGLLFHENRLFRDKSVRSPADSNPSEPETNPAAPEYDYAYNDSWHMGVRMNVNLALNSPVDGSMTSMHANPVPSTMTSTMRNASPRQPSTRQCAPNDSGPVPMSYGQQHPQPSAPPMATMHAALLPSQVVSRSSPSPMVASQHLPLEQQTWYHPYLTRVEAEALLADQPEGSFLVRNSETCMVNYSLTIKLKTVLHMKISRNPNGQFILGEYSQPYSSVPQMIHHYARIPVPVHGAECVYLAHPVHLVAAAGSSVG